MAEETDGLHCQPSKVASPSEGAADKSGAYLVPLLLCFRNMRWERHGKTTGGHGEKREQTAAQKDSEQKDRGPGAWPEETQCSGGWPRPSEQRSATRRDGKESPQMNQARREQNGEHNQARREHNSLSKKDAQPSLTATEEKPTEMQAHENT